MIKKGGLPPLYKGGKARFPGVFVASLPPQQEGSHAGVEGVAGRSPTCDSEATDKQRYGFRPVTYQDNSNEPECSKYSVRRINTDSQRLT
jgi:hypothetical protein